MRRVGGLVLIVAVAALLVGINASRSSVPTDSELSLAKEHFPALPHLDIDFAANSTAEVESLITTDRPYIEPGDSFDLDSGSPSELSLNMTALNDWAGLLHGAYPNASIYATTSGLAHYAEVAGNASSNFTGIFYDYEPNYEPEYNASFAATLTNFQDAAKIAAARGFESVGYPTGRPILGPHFAADNWSYAALGSTVDQLVVQTQTYCSHLTDFGNAVNHVLGEYTTAGEPRTNLSFQITLGNNVSLTRNEVSPKAAYRCARDLTEDNLPSLYLWWGPGSNSDVVEFLKDIGRVANS